MDLSKSYFFCEKISQILQKKGEYKIFIRKKETPMKRKRGIFIDEAKFLLDQGYKINEKLSVPNEYIVFICPSFNNSKNNYSTLS